MNWLAQVATGDIPGWGTLLVGILGGIVGFIVTLIFNAFKGGRTVGNHEAQEAATAERLAEMESNFKAHQKSEIEILLRLERINAELANLAGQQERTRQYQKEWHDEMRKSLEDEKRERAQVSQALNEWHRQMLGSREMKGVSQ